MARTTLTLDDDALAAARKYAERRGQTLGEAVSELVLRGAKREFLTDDIGGFHVYTWYWIVLIRQGIIL